LDNMAKAQMLGVPPQPIQEEVLEFDPMMGSEPGSFQG